MATAALGHLTHATDRRASARELCQRARQRLRATRRCVVESRARLEGATRGGTELERAEDDHKVVQLPRVEARECAPRDELATLLEFVRRAPAAQDSGHNGERARVESVLGQILWDFGAEQARPLVEAALALLDASDGSEGDAIQPEIEALRSWLERHPS